VAQQFNNLFDFFNFIEFCPLCKKRTEPIITLSGMSGCELNNSYLTVFQQDSNKKILIDLFNNNIIENYLQFISPDVPKLIIGRQCNKYHFYYSGTCDLLKDKLLIDNIILEKNHIVRMLADSVHFIVNNDFNNSISTIHITSNYLTKTITMPLIDFDFSSKKLIDKKLKIIQLLG
jgi:hypothetical protein